MDLKNLVNINIKDLKNINPKQIQEFAKSRPDIFINILLIVVTLYATMYVYNHAREKSASTTTNISQAEEKVNVADGYKKLEKDFNDFKEKFPKPIPSDQFINKLSEFALKNNVQTLSFSQPQKSGDEALELTTINFNIASEDYPNILMFIKDIESAPYAVRLNKFSASLKNLGQERRARFIGQEQESDKSYIEVNLEVSILDLKK